VNNLHVISQFYLFLSCMVFTDKQMELSALLHPRHWWCVKIGLIQLRVTEGLVVGPSRSCRDANSCHLRSSSTIIIDHIWNARPGYIRLMKQFLRCSLSPTCLTFSPRELYRVLCLGSFGSFCPYFVSS